MQSPEFYQALARNERAQILAEQYGGCPASPSLLLADIHAMAQVETLHFAVRATDGGLLARLDAFLAMLAATEGTRRATT